MSEIPFKADAKHLSLEGVLTFGAFKGRTVQQVADAKPSYLVWAIKTIGWFELSREARKYTQRKLNIEAQNRIDRMAFGGILPSSPDDGDDDEPDWGESMWSEFGNN